MEALSTSILVFSETEKTTSVCNFQTMTINSLVMPRDMMRDQMRSYAYMQI